MSLGVINFARTLLGLRTREQSDRADAAGGQESKTQPPRQSDASAPGRRPKVRQDPDLRAVSKALDAAGVNRKAFKQLAIIEAALEQAEPADLAALGVATLGSAMCQARFLLVQLDQHQLLSLVKRIEVAHADANARRRLDVETTLRSAS